MKQLCSAFLLSLVFAIIAKAQEYKKFKVGIGLGLGLFGGVDYQLGAAVAVEPAYRITDNLAVGLRIEGIGRGGFDGPDRSFASYTVNGQHYFSAKKFRPFAGGGLGLYTDGSRVGFYPRLGFDLGHFCLAMDFNLIPSTVTSPPGQSNIYQVTHYLGIRCGVVIGGAKK